MENASKALILAASVLIAILIIAMGVTIFNKAQNSADTSSLDQTEINMFNQKFERYNNTQLGSQVKSLISFAISNASTNKDDPVKLPTVVFTPEVVAHGTTVNGNQDASNKIDDYIDGLGGIRNRIVSTHPYTVTLDYGKVGIIEKITIAW